jgi:hypothetical protein
MKDYPSNGPQTTDPSHPCFNEPPRVGLFVAENAQLSEDIGGDGVDLNPKPAGNVWPVGNKTQAQIEASSYTLAGWQHLPKFTAVVNESECQWTYFHFRNEFFNYLDNSSTGLSLIIMDQRYARTSTTQAIPPALVGQVDLVCEDIFSGVVFPLLPRPANPNNIINSKNLLETDKAFLGQNVPNPASQTTTISFYLPSGSKKGRLELFDLATARVIKHFDIYQPGEGAIEFETRSLASGIYGYRLMVDEQPIGHFKMVVTH